MKSPLPTGTIVRNIIAGILILLVTVITVVVLAFYYFRDDIKNSIIGGIKKNLNGDITFSSISLSPFRHFPDVSLEINDLKLTGSDVENTDSNICFFSRVYVSVDVIDLFSSQINIPQLSLEEGYLNLIILKDSTLNLSNLFTDKDKKPSVRKKTEIDSLPKFTFDLNLSELQITNVNIKAINHLNDNRFGIKINNYDSRISYTPGYLYSDFTLDLMIDSVWFSNKLLSSNTPLTFDSKFDLIREAKVIKLHKGLLSLGDAQFDVNGLFDIKNDGFADLNIKGKSIDKSILNFFIKESRKQNLKNARVDFNASLKGKTFTGMPLVKVDLLLSNVNLINPVNGRQIKNFNTKASFYSGEKNDFSESILLVDTLYADFPRGMLRFSGDIKNLVDPQVDINLSLDADVTDLNEFFKLNSIEYLKGRVKINERYKGKYLRKQQKLVTELNHMKLDLKDFAIGIKDLLRFDLINGSVTRKNDNYYLKDFKILYKKTDLTINGELDNLQYLFLGIEKDIKADLKIISPFFDLPDFLFFDPSIKRDFNYGIKDINLLVTVRTSVQKLLKAKSFPEFDFNISKLDAEVVGFLPPLKINSGRLIISESILGFNMKFREFRTEFLNGRFNFNAEYNSSQFERYYVKIRTDFRGISPKLVFYQDTDTIPELMQGKLYGSLLADFQFPEDTLVLNFFNLRECNIKYILPSDTIITQKLNLSLKDIYFKDNEDNSPLASLSTKGELNVGLTRSENFQINGLKFNLNVVNGNYEFNSRDTRFFGDKSVGTSHWVIKPFGETPTLNIKFDITRFYVENMLASYMEESFISGALKLYLNLESYGPTDKEILKNMKGKINLSGNTLLVRGIDADKLLQKFMRSQSFNLVDLGGVLLAGPVGLALTKGSDFARLLVMKSGESTKINKLVSNWDINEGTFNIQDAAFTTEQNRMALKGSINFYQSTMDLVVALLDNEGCSTFKQGVSGKFDNPVLGKVKVIGTLAGPVTNLYHDVFGNNCDNFYTGSLKHPEVKKKGI